MPGAESVSAARFAEEPRVIGVAPDAGMTLTYFGQVELGMDGVEHGNAFHAGVVGFRGTRVVDA